jgi:hypothetical protein
MPPPIFLLVYVLAVARVVRFVTSDEIFRSLRNWIIGQGYLRAHPWVRTDPDNKKPGDGGRLAKSVHTGPPPLLSYMVICPWCVSIYLGAGAAPLVWFYGSSPWLLVPALALAGSYVIGFLASHEG